MPRGGALLSAGGRAPWRELECPPYIAPFPRAYRGHRTAGAYGQRVRACHGRQTALCGTARFHGIFMAGGPPLRNSNFILPKCVKIKWNQLQHAPVPLTASAFFDRIAPSVPQNGTLPT